MSRIFDALYSSEKIVKSIGNASLIDGRSLSESLTIDGIPYWDVFASELASRYIPSAFGDLSFTELFIQFIKPSLIKVKYFIRDFARSYKNEYISKPLSNRILCLEFMPQQSRDVMQPVVRYLINEKHVQIISLRDKNLRSDMKPLNSNELHATIWNFWNDELNAQANTLNKQSKLIKNFFVKSKVLEGIVDISGSAFKKRIQKVLNRLFVAEFSALIRQGVIAKFILEKHRPSLVIATDVHDPRTRIYLLQCKRLNIPSLVLQHGLTNASGTEWRFFCADRVAVWGKHFKDILITHGIASDKIFVTGPPRTDSLLISSDFEAKTLKKKFGISKHSRVILLASTFVLESYNKFNNDTEILETMKRAIFDSLENLENTYLIVKLHPHEKANETKSFASNSPKVIFVDKEEDIRPLTKICDCFISFNSTTTIDAILLNKLVICPAFPGWLWNNTFIDTKAVYAPSSPEEINDILKIVSKSNHTILINKLKKARKKLLSTWVYRYDGLCAERIGNLALSMYS
jgi:surface carbohydrate biosynthesis protein